MKIRFVSENIKPVAETMDAARMARGEPGLPRRFVWRDDEYTIGQVMEQWKETSPCKHSGEEQYVRKHWYRVMTTSGEEMKIYCERRARSTREKLRRWWLYTVATPERQERVDS